MDVKAYSGWTEMAREKPPAGGTLAEVGVRLVLSRRKSAVANFTR